MAWLGAVAARCRRFLAHADRLRARRGLARLADAVGPPAPGSASIRFGHCSRLRRLQASPGFPAGRQSLWPQHLGFGATSPFFAGLQGWLVRMGASAALSGGDSRRGPVRLCRVVAGRFLQRHAPWVIISTRTNTGNCAMAGEPSIWPLMPTPTAVV